MISAELNGYSVQSARSGGAKRVNDWFTVEHIDDNTHIISEYRHWEETHAYLLNGAEESLLIDTGLGIGNILAETEKLTDNPVLVVATHAHWDHIGGHRYFPFYCHELEQDWLNGGFPLTVERVRSMVADCRDLPEGFDPEDYEIFQGTPARLLQDNDEIDIGGRILRVLHTPGHSPGHMCFYEAERGYLFTGDLVYRGTLFADYPSTDPEAYLAAMERVAALPVKRVFPAHHGLDIQPEMLLQVRDAFRQLKAEGKLRRGGGTFPYEGFAIRL